MCRGASSGGTRTITCEPRARAAERGGVATRMMGFMSAVEVRDRLADRFRLLRGTTPGPERQVTLHHAVEWSYDLLSDSERALLRAISVFAGGFIRPTSARAGQRGDEIEVSVARFARAEVARHRRSLGPADSLQHVRDDWQFAFDRLTDTGDAKATRDRHAAFFAHQAARLLGPLGRPAVLAGGGRVGRGRAGQPALGVPMGRRPQSRRGGDRHRRPRRTDGILGPALRDAFVGLRN